MQKAKCKKKPSLWIGSVNKILIDVNFKAFLFIPELVSATDKDGFFWVNLLRRGRAERCVSYHMFV